MFDCCGVFSLCFSSFEVHCMKSDAGAQSAINNVRVPNDGNDVTCASVSTPRGEGLRISYSRLIYIYTSVIIPCIKITSVMCISKERNESTDSHFCKYVKIFPFVLMKCHTC